MRMQCSLFVLLVSLGRVLAQPTVINVVQVGAIGDGVTVNTVALQHAIDSAAKLGGGTVDIPPGVFMSGTLLLKSNVNLHVEIGATLKGTTRLEGYLLHGRRVGLLFAQNSHDITIDGEGTIDGNGDLFMDLTRAKVMSGDPVKFTRQKDEFRKVLAGLGDGPCWPNDRPYQMIIFSNCTNVAVRDLKIANSPFWTLHFADCDGVLLSGATITGNLLVPNNDGVDFTSCRNVRVGDCVIARMSQ